MQHLFIFLGVEADLLTDKKKKSDCVTSHSKGNK
jgi:hypothetical protein